MSFEKWFWYGKVYNRSSKEYIPSKKSLSVSCFGAVNGKISLDRIYTEKSVESFERDLSERIGSKIHLPHINRGPARSRNTRDYFDDDMLKQVAEDFAYEYDVLGYDRPI